MPQKHPIQVTGCDKCHSVAVLGASPSSWSRSWESPFPSRARARAWSAVLGDTGPGGSGVRAGSHAGTGRSPSMGCGPGCWGLDPGRATSQHRLWKADQGPCRDRHLDCVNTRTHVRPGSGHGHMTSWQRCYPPALLPSGKFPLLATGWGLLSSGGGGSRLEYLWDGKQSGKCPLSAGPEEWRPW